MAGKPTYDLQRLQQLIGQGPLTRRITNSATDAAALLGLGEDDIVEVVLSLAPAQFYKSMEAERRPGLWQDVYHAAYHGVGLYIKLQLEPAGLAVVVQFKRR
jgi:motility quorum-sensing regulator / GCU-specific mRNA interferase toxin